MTQVQTFKNELFNLSVQTDGAENLFNAEDVAKALGFIELKNGKEYVRWRTISKYLSQQVANSDFISEPMVYKLAFKANNAVAEKFTDWLAIEVLPTIRKTGGYQSKFDYSNLSPELQMMNQMLQAVANNEREQQRQAKELVTVKNDVDNISSIVALNVTDWRRESQQLVRKIAYKLGGGYAYKEVSNQIYAEVDRRAASSLKTRLTNLKRVMAEEGASKSKREKVNFLDVIDRDKRLREIYIAVVKDFAIKYNVSAA